MPTASYQQRLSEVAEYFDRHALDAWARLTSDAPVGRIRATVRAGRDAMRETLLSWLPADLTGLRLLDAGCGTGALAVEAARRGARVVAVDVSPSLIEIANERLPHDIGAGHIDFIAGDMLDEALGEFDHLVAMDSLIHYDTPDMAASLARVAARVRRSVLFTFAPRTRPLALMHAVGRLFPRGDRAPSIVPVRPAALTAQLEASPALDGFEIGRTRRIASGFYTSQALELWRDDGGAS